MRARRFRLRPFLFILPAAAIYGVFLLYPMLQTAVMSLWRWNGISPGYTWVGLDNYARLIGDGSVWRAAWDNLKWIILAILPVALGLLLAVLLHRARPRASNLFRTLFFLPYVLPTVVIAYAWGWIYQPSYGALNAALKGVGLGMLESNWLGSPSSALIALAVAADWAGFGFCMTLFIAGLNAIDPSLYDAAKVDGANAWQQFRFVTLPGLANTTNTVVLIVFINTVRVFDIAWVLTAGGPAGSTEVLGTQIYRQTFQNLDIGYGAAISMLMVIVVLICTVIFLRLRERSAS